MLTYDFAISLCYTKADAECVSVGLLRLAMSFSLLHFFMGKGSLISPKFYYVQDKFIICVYSSVHVRPPRLVIGY